MSREPLRIDIKVNGKNYTTAELATLLDSALAEEKRAILRWARLTEGRKAAVSVLVSKLLSVMNDDMIAWLPSAIKTKTPTLIEVTFKLLVSDIDILVAEAEYEEELRKSSAIESLSEMLDDKHEVATE